jgi:hypothetical protein
MKRDDQGLSLSEAEDADNFIEQPTYALVAIDASVVQVPASSKTAGAGGGTKVSVSRQASRAESQAGAHL